MNERVKTEMLYIRSVQPHYHANELEILLVLEGNVTVCRMERRMELKEGQFTFINRRIVHHLISEGAYVLITTIRLSEFRYVYDRIESVEFMNQDDVANFKRPLRERLNMIVVDFMIKDYQLGKNPQMIAEKEFYENQLVYFIFVSYQMAECLKKEEGYLNRDMMDRFYLVAEYIMNHIYEKITVEDILKLVYMNPTYFSQFMKKAGGVGFKDFLTYRKLMVIEMLLIDDQHSMSEIANMVDLGDMKAFYHVFKKYFKTSPAKWREYLQQIADDYEVLEEKQILESFILKYRINKHQENNMARLYRYISECRKNGISLKDVEIIIDPYADMSDNSKEDYQPYKYSGALFSMLHNMHVKLILTYSMKILRDTRHSELMINSMKGFMRSHGANEVRKWGIILRVEEYEDFAAAQIIRQKFFNMGIMNIHIVLAADSSR